ncbi:MAG: metallophosphatase family protein [Lachnospiraceae bacterium]|nr:metallophosphatase family protein [Lachnospiraceae bacterium]
MKYVIISDAHGNRIFFDIVMKEIDNLDPERIIFLGDAFGYMRDGLYILEELKKRNAVILKGNHEAMLNGEIRIDDEKDVLYGLKEQSKTIDVYTGEILRQLPEEVEIELRHKKALCIHGAPYDHVCGYLYENNVNYAWKEERYDYVFMGHTHRPYIKKTEQTIFVNVGSIGMPRDTGLAPSYVLFDEEIGEPELIRVKILEEVLNSDYYSGLDQRIMDVFRRKQS